MRSVDYANKVLSGEIIASRFIKLRAQQHLDDFKRKDIYWDQDEVDRVFWFLEKTVYVPELRRPVEVPLPHAFWIEQLYGWKMKDGTRRFRTVYIQVARKSFKTFYAAAISLVELLLYNDTYPEILHGANSREQALICTGKTGEIIKKSPKLTKLWKNNSGNLKIFSRLGETGKITFENKNRRGKIEAMPKNPGDGGNPSVGIVDEFHESKTMLLMETIKSGQGQRDDPMTLVITSPGYDMSLPCYTDLRDISVKTLEGSILNDRHLPIMFELDSEDEWDNIVMLEKSNPMLPYSNSLKPFLEERILEAKRTGGMQASSIKVKNCGMWIDQPSIWIPSEVIKECNWEINEDDLLGMDCVGGLDLSAGMDLNSFVLIFNVDGKIIVKSFFWIPRDKFEGKHSDGVDYRRWAENGHLKVFDGNTVEYDVIAGDMIREMDKYNVLALAADPKYLSMSAVQFFKDTHYLAKIAKISQSYGTLAGATEKVEQLCNERNINFLGNPVMHWNFSCVQLRIGEMGDRMPSKGKSNGRIDGVAALVTGMSDYLRRGLDQGGFFADVW